MRRRGTWTLLIVALVLVAAGAVAPAAGAKPPKPAPPSTEAPATTVAPKASKVTPPSTAAPTTTTVPASLPEAGLQVAATPAPGPEFSVTPTRDLEHLQVVQVSGTGYGPGEGVQVVQCRAGTSFAFDDCDTGTTRFLFADDSGSWATDFTVYARLGLTPPFDCLDGFGDCVIGVAHGDEFAIDRTVPIGFAPDAIPPPPKVSVTPRTDLAHGQQITVSGTGVAGGAIVLIGQCLPWDGQTVDCASQGGAITGADADGAFETTVTVTRLFNSAFGRVVDCVTDDCVIQVAAIDGLYNIVDTPIRFDPDAPVPPRPSLTIDPDTDLEHNQVVRVTGQGFVPGRPILLTECSREGDPFPQCTIGPNLTDAAADASGAFETTYTVKRVIGYPGQAVDCIEVGCLLHAASLTGEFFPPGDDVFSSADATLEFDPEAPLPPAPVLTVTPSDDLVHNQLVTVRGRGFTPNAFVNLYECVEDEDDTYSQCSYAYDELLFTDSTGAFSTTFVVKRIVGFFGGATTDCLEARGCVLIARVGEDPITGFAELDLDLDRDAPLPPPPTLVVTPDSELGARQEVEVRGRGFAPATEHNLVQCPDDGDRFAGLPCSFGPTVTTDEHGSIDTTFLARRLLPGVEPGSVIDCAATGDCVLSMVAFEDPLSHATASVRFDPDAPPPPKPTIAVAPDTGLVEGAVVTVTGRDFLPNAVVALSQCDGIDHSGLSCDGSILKFVPVGDDGTFTTEYAVKAGIFAPRGIVGCYDAPGACTMQAATFGEIGGESNAAPLSFGPPVTPPDGGSGGNGGGGGGTTPAPVRRQPAQPLALTGTPVRGYLEFAAIFLGLGTLLVLASRRRRLWG